MTTTDQPSVLTAEQIDRIEEAVNYASQLSRWDHDRLCSLATNDLRHVIRSHRTQAATIAALQAERERLRVALDPLMTETFLIDESGYFPTVHVGERMWMAAQQALNDYFYPRKEATDEH